MKRKLSLLLGNLLMVVGMLLMVGSMAFTVGVLNFCTSFTGYLFRSLPDGDLYRCPGVAGRSRSERAP
ncbi:Uncharacterised protein [Morganella morganii]|nr:Uncharacterised protein [Morganella morganii]